MTGTIYDHPLYYDILFGWDRTPEADFYEEAFRHHRVPEGARVLEVACGGGQVARRLALRGWNVSGLDSRPAMLAFLEQQSGAEGASVETIHADMESFRAGEAFAAAYNPLSSFRLLHDDRSAHAHLGALAEALLPGGIYVLDMSFLGAPEEPATTTGEEWEMTRGRVSVRAQDEAIHVNDDGVEQVIAWGEELHLRGYLWAGFRELVAEVPALALASWHPESGRNPEGVSLFSVGTQGEGPAVGRAMVVLKRR